MPYFVCRTMELRKLKKLTYNQKSSLMLLWNKEYPSQLAYKSMEEFELYLESLTEVLHLLIYDANILIGWALKFTREGARWFAVIISSQFHNRGLGANLLKEIKEGEKSLNGWVVDHNNYHKLNGATYLSPLDFYLKNNFKIDPTSRIENPRLSAVRVFWDWMCPSESC